MSSISPNFYSHHHRCEIDKKKIHRYTWSAQRTVRLKSNFYDIFENTNRFKLNISFFSKLFVWFESLACKPFFLSFNMMTN